MATKKDLVEAYSFSRRRLVTAFVSGAPGGREVEPAKPGRAIVGGLALGVLLVAAGAIAGVFTTQVDPAWAQKQGLIISKEEGSVYVIVNDSSDPVLHPILNITSAKLILGPDVEPQLIPDSYIDDETRGSDLGILGAPSDVPDTDNLIGTGWTACTAEDHGVRLDVSRRPEVSIPSGGGLLVAVDGERYVVAEGGPDADGGTQAYRYHVGNSAARDNLLDALGLPPWRSAVEVSASWLNLFPEGGELDFESFRLDGFGQSYNADAGGDTFTAAVGDVLNTTTGYKLVTQRGLVDLDEFAFAVYTNLDRNVHVDTVQKPAPDIARAEPPFLAAHWPTSVLDPVPGELCGQLETVAGHPPEVHLVSDPSGDASAAAVPAGQTSPVVDDGAGAYVRSGSWDSANAGHPFLVDAKGQAYPLVGGDAASQLGYARYRAPVVPDSWVALFDEGVELSKNLALCSPRLDLASPCG